MEYTHTHNVVRHKDTRRKNVVLKSHVQFNRTECVQCDETCTFHSSRNFVIDAK